MWKLRKALNGLRRLSLLLQNFLFRIITKKLGFMSAVVYHTETSVKMLVLQWAFCSRHWDNVAYHTDHGIDRATTSRVLRDTIVEHTRRCQRDGERRILRGAWHRKVRRLGKKRHIARSGQPEQRRARTDGQDKTQQFLSRSGQSAVHTSQKTRRTLCHHALLKETGEPANSRCTGAENLDRLIVWLYTTRTRSFRVKPDPNNQYMLDGWTDKDWAGCRETRQCTACGLIVWSNVVLSSCARTLTKEMILSSPEWSTTEFARSELSWCAWETHSRHWVTQFSAEHSQTDASSARSFAVRWSVSGRRHLEKVSVDTTEGGRRHHTRRSVCGRVLSSGEAVARQQQGSSKAAAKQQQGSSKAAARQQQGSSKAAERQQQGSSKAAARQQQGSSKAAAKQQQSSSKAAAKQQQSSSKAAARRQQGSSKAAAKQQQSSSKAAAENPSEVRMERSGVVAKHFVLFCSLFSDEYFAFSLLSCCFFCLFSLSLSLSEFWRRLKAAGPLTMHVWSSLGLLVEPRRLWRRGHQGFTRGPKELKCVQTPREREREEKRKRHPEREEKTFFVFFVEVLAKNSEFLGSPRKSGPGQSGAVEGGSGRAGGGTPSVSSRLGEAQRRSKSSSKAAIPTKKQQSKQAQAKRETQQQSSIKSRSENSSTSKAAMVAPKVSKNPTTPSRYRRTKKNTRAVAKKKTTTSHKTVSCIKNQPTSSLFVNAVTKNDYHIKNPPPLLLPLPPTTTTSPSSSTIKQSGDVPLSSASSPHTTPGS